MISQDWFRHVSVPAGALIFVSLVHIWLAHARDKPRSARKFGTLSYSNTQKTFFAVASTIFLLATIGFEVLPRIHGNEPTPIGLIFFFGLLFIISLTVTIRLMVENFRVSGDGISYSKFWRERKFIPWSEVVSLEKCTFGDGFLVYSKPYQRIRLSYNLIGLPEFAELALRHVDMKAADPPTQQMLRQTAEGKHPLSF